MEGDPAATTFGPFRLLSRLGRGGMAETFLAERRGEGDFVQHVCLKRILPQMSEDPEWIRFFQKEARTVASLHHSNIVTVHDVGNERGVWWMALELVEGIDLRTLLAAMRARRQTLPREIAIHIVVQLARALVHAHTRTLADGRPAPVVHRDISPSNVLISRDGDVKLSDFGIAWVPSEERTASGVARGKMSYMAPEQARGDACDARADLFSLGVVLHELLTGRRPYDGRTDLETAMNLGRGRRSHFMREWDFPPYYITVVDGLIALDADARPPSAARLLDVLRYAMPPGDTVDRLAELVRSVPANHDRHLTALDAGAQWRDVGDED